MIFNQIVGGGGGLIGAELVATTTATYRSSSKITIASIPQFTFSKDYINAVDIYLDGTPTTSLTTEQTLRFFGLMGYNVNSTSTLDLTKTYPYGVVSVQNRSPKYMGARSSTYFGLSSSASRTNVDFGIYYADTTYSAPFLSGYTYTVKFYKITLPQ